MERRTFLRRSAVVGLALCVEPAFAQEQRDQRPTPGDRLVPAEGDPRPLRLDDVSVGAAKPVVALPFDVATNTVRDGSKLNRVLLIRRSDTEVAAFSAICTHEACAVSEWLAAEQCLLCPCHFSKFDVRDGGAVVEGPAPRGLPHLPLRIEADGVLVVDGAFSSQPGVRRGA